MAVPIKVSDDVVTRLYHSFPGSKDCCNRKRTLRFIESGYNISILKEDYESGKIK